MAVANDKQDFWDYVGKQSMELRTREFEARTKEMESRAKTAIERLRRISDFELDKIEVRLEVRANAALPPGVGEFRLAYRKTPLE